MRSKLVTALLLLQFSLFIAGCPSDMPTGSGTGTTDPVVSGGDDGPTASQCRDVDLTGFWRETSADPNDPRAVQMIQTDEEIVSTFLQSYLCDHRDGQDTTTETFDDFTGQVEECIVRGALSVCRSGCDAETGEERTCGIATVPFVALFDPRDVSPNDLVLIGTWSDDEVGTAGTISYERLACAPKFAPDYALDESIDWVRKESGSGFEIVDFAAPGVCDAATTFGAGVNGTVSAIDAADVSVASVEIAIANGNTIEFTIISTLATPELLVEIGDVVEPTTAIGRFFPCEGLHIEAFDADQSRVHPDCAEEE